MWRYQCMQIEKTGVLIKLPPVSIASWPVTPGRSCRCQKISTMDSSHDTCHLKSRSTINRVRIQCRVFCAQQHAHCLCDNLHFFLSKWKPSSRSLRKLLKQLKASLSAQCMVTIVSFASKSLLMMSVCIQGLFTDEDDSALTKDHKHPSKHSVIQRYFSNSWGWKVSDFCLILNNFYVSSHWSFSVAFF